jgi:hypothetical protein
MKQPELDRDYGLQEKTIKFAGFGLIALAITVNPFVLGWLFSPDGRITSGVNISLIVFVEVIVALVGIYLVVIGSSRRTIVRGMTRQEAILLVVSSLLALIVGDVCFNLVFGSVYQPTKYGWTPLENHTTLHTVQDQPGQFRTVENRYFKAGFKRWGNINSPHTKVFILGDSLTEMVQVSNGEEWYAYLEKDFDTVEWFVYGAGGYGSLQEYMVLNDYIDQINPNLILWQFTSNDYIDNSYVWDRKYYPYNNFGVRPYLEHGEIVYRLPMPFPFLRKYSKVADLLLSIYDGKMKERARAIPRTLIHSDKIFDTDSPLTEQEKNELYRVTLEILRMARERARGIPFFLFHHSGSQRDDREQSLCVEAGMTCIPGVAEHLERQKADGVTIGVVDDGHWNKVGNRYVGEYLVQFLRHNPVAQEVLTKPNGGQ